MFDDSTFNDDSQGHIIHHDNSIPKIVSKRSVSENNSNYEPSWWDRIKRSVKSMLGYDEEQHPIVEEDQKSISPPETLPVLVDEKINEKNSLRRSRQTDDNDDEDEDDDDNEIPSGDGIPSESWDRDEVSSPTPKSEEIPSSTLPDIPDSKYCKISIFKQSLKKIN